MKEPVLIHIPHSSLYIPIGDRDEILLNDSELFIEQLRLTDRYTDELYQFNGVTIQKNQFSRMILDPERFRDDQDESMSQFGMGAIYTNTVDGNEMKKLSESTREEKLEKYYDPYHLEFEGKVEKLINDFGKCLIIDGHSFPEDPLPFELDQNPNRPDICIGTCDFHTPEILVTAMEDFLKKRGLSVKRNIPFVGTIVPMKFYKKDARVSSVMIEVNRRCYMDEATGEKLKEFPLVQGMISDLLKRMLEIYKQLDTHAPAGHL